ncbi:MAG: response regulator transcription factor [Bacteroidota bacterium]
MDRLYKEYKILITDDHLVIQQGLSFMIKDFLPKALLSYAGNLETTLTCLKKEKVDLLILDINMPGGNNFQMIERIKEVQSDVKILLFSAYGEDIYGLRYLKAGVNGYLEKSAPEKEIQEAIIRVLVKGKYLGSKVQNQMIDNFNSKLSGSSLDQLTNREFEIASFLVNGERTSSIGQKLALKVSTVSTHKNRIFQKLNVTNVSELITEFKLDFE